LTRGRSGLRYQAWQRSVGQAERPMLLDKETYKKVKYIVERFSAWIKQFRKLTVRYERLAETFLGLIHIACIVILWRVLK